MPCSPSVLLSIFKRKGGEGAFTRLLDEQNYQHYHHVLSFVSTDDKALIISYLEESNWVLLCEKTMIGMNDGELYSYRYTDITRVFPAMEEEYKTHGKTKLAFTMIKIEVGESVRVIKVENGKPYWGIYNFLRFALR